MQGLRYEREVCPSVAQWRKVGIAKKYPPDPNGAGSHRDIVKACLGRRDGKEGGLCLILMYRTIRGESLCLCPPREQGTS